MNGKTILGYLSPEKGTTHVLAFCLTVFLAVAMLAVSAFLPQGRIQDHILESVDLAEKELQDIRVLDRSTASTLDVGTDLLMLQTSMSTTNQYLGSILTNPVYVYDGMNGWFEKDDVLANLACEFPSDGVWFYARYWLGFRALLRLALVFFNYGQIKRYLAFAVFSLLAMALCSVAKNTNTKLAMAFALSIILVRPHIIATSLQFSSCFLIMFLAMLLVPLLYRHPKWETLFFMELGMVTMYFDFYTVPLITLGFPLVYLYALRMEREDAVSGKLVLKDFLAWFLGYGGMWIAKLTLTSALTSVDALEQGIGSFLSRLGIQKEERLAEYYSLEAAFEGIREAVFSDATGEVVYWIGAGIVIICMLIALFRGRLSLENRRFTVLFFLMALVPLGWFVITKQPIAIHYFFQYRTIALTHWAAGVCLYSLFRRKKITL